MQALVAAPGAVVGGLVVVEGVRPSVAATGPAERAEAAAAGMGRRVAPGAVAGAAGLFLALAAAGVVLGSLAGLLTLALASTIGGLLAGVGAEAALAPRVIGLVEAVAAGRAGAVDDAHVHRRSPLPFRAGVAQQLIGTAAATAGHGDHLGRGHGRAAVAFAGDQRPHLGPHIECGGQVRVRVGGAVLRIGRGACGRRVLAVAAGRAVECDARGAGGWLGRWWGAAGVR